MTDSAGARTVERVSDTTARSSSAGPSGHAVDVDHITILAHDLRNYLTPVMAQLQALHGRARRDERELDMRAAGRGRQALDAALSLLANLVNIARLDHGLEQIVPVPQDLGSLVDQVAERFQTDALPVVVRGATWLPVRADPDRIQQLFHNLLANAVAHAPAGSTVLVERELVHSAAQPWASVAISNAVLRSPYELLPLLFERWSVGPGSRGLGLGLYLARRIAEAHGGTLTAHAADSTTLCLTLALPLDQTRSRCGS